MDIQILRVGQLVILCVPGEFTTMAGRRLREAIHAQVESQILVLIFCVILCILVLVLSVMCRGHSLQRLKYNCEI